MKYDEDTLKSIIDDFISTGSEGDSWDFKLKWHENKTDLLKDILCFANTTHYKDCFLIIGISNDLEIIGLKKEEQTWNLAKITDLLNNTPFVGGNHPAIDLKSIHAGERYVDVLIIRNSEDVPYYLTTNKGTGLFQNVIYTRENDSNVVASFAALEKLWKKRFGFYKDILDRFKNLLKDPENWNSSDPYIYHHKIFPEFCLKTSARDKHRTGIPFYAYAMCNSSVYFQSISLRHGATLLKRILTVVLDGGRLAVVAPETEVIGPGESISGKYCYRYFAKDSLAFLLNDFLYKKEEGADDARIAKNEFDEVVLTFEDDEERLKFNDLILQNQKKIDRLILMERVFCEGTESDQIDLKTGKVFVRALAEYRKNKWKSDS